MFVSWRTYRAQTGVVETELPFGCQRCGAQCPMRVRTQGLGSSTALYGAIGGGADQARQAAVGNAQANAHQAARFVRCPQCGATAHDAFHAALVDRSETRTKRALPYAAALGGATALVLGGLGLLDAGVTLSPTVAGLGVAALLFGLVLATMSRPLPMVGPPMAEVWLSWTTAQGPQWIPGQLAAPQRAASRGTATVVGVLSAVFGGIVALVALGMWASTFGTLYVLETSGKTSIDVKVDGVTASATTRATKDAALFSGNLFSVSVRTNKPHTIVVDGLTHELTGKGDWLFVTGKEARDVCLYEREAIYSASPGDPSTPTMLSKGGGVVINLPHSYQHLLEPPPASVTVKQGQSERRWVLRAFKCSDMNGPED